MGTCLVEAVTRDYMDVQGWYRTCPTLRLDQATQLELDLVAGVWRSLLEGISEGNLTATRRLRVRV